MKERPTVRDARGNHAEVYPYGSNAFLAVNTCFSLTASAFMQVMPAEGVARTRGRVLSLYRDILRTGMTWRGGSEVLSCIFSTSQAKIICLRPPELEGGVSSLHRSV